MAAASAGNQQPCQFVVIRVRETLRASTAAHAYARMFPNAPVAVLVCGDPEGCKWPRTWDQDCAAATENLLVEAALLGLGAVWLGVHPLAERVDGIRELLGIPASASSAGAAPPQRMQRAPLG